MSGDWIKVECALPDKPEVWQMAGMLGIDADSVVGKLLRVWAWFDAHTVDGNAAGVTYPLLDRIAGVSGFAEAMALAGWLRQDGSVLSLPNFGRHNGKTAKNRALTNKRVADHREMQRSSNGGETQDVTQGALQKPLPEKRREEKNKSKSKPSPAATALPEIPDWVPAESWAGFVEMRKKERHALTPRAAQLVLRELDKLRADGHDPGAVLDQSTRNGWRDVFPIKPSRSGGSSTGYQPWPGEI